MKPTAAIEIQLNRFSYGATAKVHTSDIGVDALGDSYPGVSAISFTSRSFDSYEECSSSCRVLMDDLLVKLNSGRDLFKLGSEVNPVHSGTPTLSRDWGPGEIARLWIYDKKMEKAGQIHAVGQARIFGIVEQPSQGLN